MNYSILTILIALFYITSVVDASYPPRRNGTAPLEISISGKLLGQRVKGMARRAYTVSLVVYDARLADTNNTVAGRKYTTQYLTFPHRYNVKVPIALFGEDNRYAISASIRDTKDSLVWLTTTATFIHPKKVVYDLQLTKVGN